MKLHAYQQEMADRLASQTHAVFDMPEGTDVIRVMCHALSMQDGNERFFIISPRVTHCTWDRTLYDTGIGPQRYMLMTQQRLAMYNHDIKHPTDLIVVHHVPFRANSVTHTALSTAAKRCRKVWYRPWPYSFDMGEHTSKLYFNPRLTDDPYELIVMDWPELERSISEREKGEDQIR